MDHEWSCDGSVFQMAGTATWKLCQTKICPTRNSGNWDADIVEVCGLAYTWVTVICMHKTPTRSIKPWAASDVVICASYTKYAHNQHKNSMHGSLTWCLLINLGSCSVLASVKPGHLPVMIYADQSNQLWFISCQLQLCIIFRCLQQRQGCTIYLLGLYTGHQL